MNKLKGRENIASLFESGKRLSEYPLQLYYKKADEPAFGVSVGKRRFPLAVD
ncbi:MAG: ribonuclease P protein component [Bacteroidota bacterium]|nr:ribonuclease P protein component [Bacteroidota bacterium]